MLLFCSVGRTAAVATSNVGQMRMRSMPVLTRSFLKMILTKVKHVTAAPVTSYSHNGHCCCTDLPAVKNIVQKDLVSTVMDHVLTHPMMLDATAAVLPTEQNNDIHFGAPKVNHNRIKSNIVNEVVQSCFAPRKENQRLPALWF